MKVPLSWLKEFVEIDLSLPELAYRLTMAGLEVEEIRLVGLPMPEGAHEFKIEAFPGILIRSWWRRLKRSCLIPTQIGWFCAASLMGARR